MADLILIPTFTQDYVRKYKSLIEARKALEKRTDEPSYPPYLSQLGDRAVNLWYQDPNVKISKTADDLFENWTCPIADNILRTIKASTLDDSTLLDDKIQVTTDFKSSINDFIVYYNKFVDVYYKRAMKAVSDIHNLIDGISGVPESLKQLYSNVQNFSTQGFTSALAPHIFDLPGLLKMAKDIRTQINDGFSGDNYPTIANPNIDSNDIMQLTDPLVFDLKGKTTFNTNSSKYANVEFSMPDINGNMTTKTVVDWMNSNNKQAEFLNLMNAYLAAIRDYYNVMKLKIDAENAKNQERVDALAALDLEIAKLIKIFFDYLTDISTSDVFGKNNDGIVKLITSETPIDANNLPFDVDTQGTADIDAYAKVLQDSNRLAALNSISEDTAKSWLRQTYPEKSADWLTQTDFVNKFNTLDKYPKYVSNINTYITDVRNVISQRLTNDTTFTNKAIDLINNQVANYAKPDPESVQAYDSVIANLNNARNALIGSDIDPKSYNPLTALKIILNGHYVGSGYTDANAIPYITKDTEQGPFNTLYINHGLYDKVKVALDTKLDTISKALKSAHDDYDTYKVRQHDEFVKGNKKAINDALAGIIIPTKNDGQSYIDFASNVVTNIEKLNAINIPTDDPKADYSAESKAKAAKSILLNTLLKNTIDNISLPEKGSDINKYKSDLSDMIAGLENLKTMSGIPDALVKILDDKLVAAKQAKDLELIDEIAIPEKKLSDSADTYAKTINDKIATLTPENLGINSTDPVVIDALNKKKADFKQAANIVLLKDAKEKLDTLATVPTRNDKSFNDYAKLVEDTIAEVNNISITIPKAPESGDDPYKDYRNLNTEQSNDIVALKNAIVEAANSDINTEIPSKEDNESIDDYKDKLNKLVDSLNDMDLTKIDDDHRKAITEARDNKIKEIQDKINSAEYDSWKTDETKPSALNKSMKEASKLDIVSDSEKVNN